MTKYRFFREGCFVWGEPKSLKEIREHVDFEADTESEAVALFCDTYGLKQLWDIGYNTDFDVRTINAEDSDGNTTVEYCEDCGFHACWAVMVIEK